MELDGKWLAGSPHLPPKLKTFDRFCWKSHEPTHPSLPSLRLDTAAGLGMGVCLGRWRQEMLCDLEIRNVLRLANLGVLCRVNFLRCVHALLCAGSCCLPSALRWLWLGVPRDLHRHCLTSLFTRTMRQVCWISVHRQEMEAQEDPAQVDHSWPQQQGFLKRKP